MRTIWIVRHMHREDADNPNWPGQAPYPDDPDLSPLGHAQAQQLAQFFAERPLDYIFCSPFLRALSTAQPVARLKKLPIHVEPGLSESLTREFFPVAPQLHDPATLRQRFPEIDPDYQPLYVPQYPEEGLAAMARAGQVALALVQRFPGNLLLVGHGASVWGATWGLLPQKPEIHCDFGALVEITETPNGWQLQKAGVTDYLVGALSQSYPANYGVRP
ncbi:MAG: histidine phosphatase family protein [Gloeomargarita sp. SKYBB_i_bin120]|nr:histidine phosphatase family protein [Gloeomargarita sp. SKYB120]MDW8176992.1 histidine phosphatase family protein [Gloeomargarita sp. SKYBB_i_bin120]